MGKRGAATGYVPSIVPHPPGVPVIDLPFQMKDSPPRDVYHAALPGPDIGSARGTEATQI